MTIGKDTEIYPFEMEALVCPINFYRVRSREKFPFRSRMFPLRSEIMMENQ